MRINKRKKLNYCRLITSLGQYCPATGCRAAEVQFSPVLSEPRTGPLVWFRKTAKPWTGLTVQVQKGLVPVQRWSKLRTELFIWQLKCIQKKKLHKKLGHAYCTFQKTCQNSNRHKIGAWNLCRPYLKNNLLDCPNLFYVTLSYIHCRTWCSWLPWFLYTVAQKTVPMFGHFV